MDIRLLDEFVVLATHLNYHAAAEELFMNQSTLSRHIALLENELGIALFTRSTRHVDLTDAGRAILDDVKSITDRYRLMVARINNERFDCVLRLGGFIPHEDLEKPLTTTLERLAHTHPWITVQETNTLAQDYKQSLLEDCYDVMILPCSQPNQDVRFSYRYILSSPLRVWVNRDNPLADKTCLSLDDLKDQSLRFMSMGEEESWYEWQYFINQLFEEKDIVLRLKPPTGLSLGLSTYEYALVPSGEAGMYRDKIAVIPLENTTNVDFYMISRSMTDNPAASIFINEMVDVCQTLL